MTLSQSNTPTATGNEAMQYILEVLHVGFRHDWNVMSANVFSAYLDCMAGVEWRQINQ